MFLLSLLASTCLFAGDKLLFESREIIEGALGAPSEPIQNAQGALRGSDVRRFSKDGWSYVIYFDRSYSHRVIISKQDGTALTDKEVATFLTPNKAYNEWSEWMLPKQRAWVSDGKMGPFYALFTTDTKKLELLTYRYVVDLGLQSWLDSTQ